jgi:stearoyl-CoA desaturase (delta-9 desaturase)
MKHKNQQILKFILICLFAIAGATLYVITGGTWQKALIVYVLLGMIKVTANVAYHRWLAHSYIEPGYIGKFVLLYSIVCGALVRPIHYVIGHRLHHRYPDTDNDPHPPSIGFWNSLIGNFNEVKTAISVKDVYRKKEVVFVNNHFYKLYFLNLLMWCLIDIQVVFLSFLFLNLRQLISVTLFNYLGHGGSKELGAQNLPAYYSYMLGWFGEQLHKNHHNDPSNPNYGKISTFNFDLMYYILKHITKTRKLN